MWRLSGSPPPQLIRKLGPPSISTGRTLPSRTYDPDADGERLASALVAGGGFRWRRPQINLSGLEVRPFPHRDQILEALEIDASTKAGARSQLSWWRDRDRKDRSGGPETTGVWPRTPSDAESAVRRASQARSWNSRCSTRTVRFSQTPRLAKHS